MEKGRIRIADIAEELGLSTATVSNVIHGKTGKISDETVKRVQELIEKSGYIPSMAGILLAQNNSKIIGVVVNDHEKYEGHVLEDGFISASVNALSREIDGAGYFMMIKVTTKWDEIVRFASMWNMDGLVMIGFCEQDYQKLRESMHIPFVVYDGYFQETQKICNLVIDNYNGGYQMGEYLKRMGHKKVLCISDNCICMDLERMEGFRAALGREQVDFLEVPFERKERMKLYQQREEEILKHTAVFAVSDFYAVELIRYLQEKDVRVPEDLSVAGFDDSPLCNYCNPALTTVRQDAAVRARTAVSVLKNLKMGTEERIVVKLPTFLVERKSVKKLPREDWDDGKETNI
ncbi:LacI family transcriptional regulator [Petralouisia muris]|uniref:LacI family transcriptional regulator n=1 Tax=Petralouisia muris TaxID=3032872 RepID=A0AC61RR30_9FIRM|nr:LacI family DNA-binding transcriptional regulator [Petralouisia muris]TGY91547.1 LacI family transcriptional regulator [Petralouisia muris]